MFASNSINSEIKIDITPAVAIAATAYFGVLAKRVASRNCIIGRVRLKYNYNWAENMLSALCACLYVL